MAQELPELWGLVVCIPGGAGRPQDSYRRFVVNEILLFGIGLPVIVAAVIQVLKAFGLPDEWAPQAALVTGVVLSYVAQLVAQFPDLGWWLSPLILGVVAWAGSTGVYHVVKNVLGKDHAEEGPK